MKRGFTLVEMLVTISLIGLGISVAAVNFTATARNERVNSATERVRQLLAQAKNNAQNGVKDCGACGAAGGICGAAGDRPLQGWRVVFTQNVAPTADAVAIEGICSLNPYPAAGFTIFSSRTENLPEGVNMTISGALDSVLYRPRGGGIYPLPVMGVGWSRTFTFTQVTTAQTLVINSGGTVQ